MDLTAITLSRSRRSEKTRTSTAYLPIVNYCFAQSCFRTATGVTLACRSKTRYFAPWNESTWPQPFRCARYRALNFPASDVLTFCTQAEHVRTRPTYSLFSPAPTAGPSSTSGLADVRRVRGVSRLNCLIL